MGKFRQSGEKIMENRNQFAEKMINIQKQIITDNNGYYYMDIGRETFYACRKHYEAMLSELKANYVISETDFLISDEIKCDWCGNYNSKLNKMIQKEKHKVICITLGINETRVLKYLNSKEEFDSFDNIYEAHKHYISMKYPLQLSQFPFSSFQNMFHCFVIISLHF